MAAVTFTAIRPANSSTVTDNITAGATITAGQSVYQDTADSNKAKTAIATSQAAALVKGLALTPGVANGGLVVAISGSIVLVGATMTVGLTYYQGATAGTIVPEADLASTNWVTRLGVASSATQLDLSITATGIQRA